MKPEPNRDASAVQRLGAALEPALGPLERVLAASPFLLGERMSTYDVVLACTLMPARASDEFARQSPMWAFLRDNLSLPESMGGVRGWVDRVLEHDVPPARP